MGAFNKQKHITYWLRCLKTFLPYQYTSMDNNRMMLAFFTISALDILDALDSNISEAERQGHVEWIYGLQHPGGGFRGGLPLLADDHSAVAEDGGSEEVREGRWDPASVPATYFALATLVILKDDLGRVERNQCLQWLRGMQRKDGSFGQALGSDGTVQGGRDTRFGYLAMGIRWMLGDGSASTEDLDAEALVSNTRDLQTYDGGFSEEPFHEAHGGYTYCAIAALAILGRLEDGINDTSALMRWLVARQTRNLDPEDDEEDVDYAGESEASAPIGFNGRCNKIGDTCYTFWIAGTLKAIGRLDLIDKQAATAYLIDETQHFIGGFMKYPGDPPDIYHSYLGLLALGVFEHPDIKPVHEVACMSRSAVEYLEQEIIPQYR